MATDITWLKTDWPPHQISSGPYQDKGTFDLLQKQLMAELPQFRHHIKVVNLARLEQAFKQKDKTVCSFGTIFTAERASNRWYSAAISVLPGLAVHFRRSAAMEQHNAVQKNGAVDVLSLVRDNTLTGAYQPNRFYPPSVVKATQFAHFTPQELSSQVNAASLLLSHRVDYVVEYPERMEFYLKQKQHSEGIQSFSVADASPVVVSYITCNKSKSAQGIIQHINAALVTLWQTDEYRQAMFSWVDKQSQVNLEQAFQQTRQQVMAEAKH